MAQLMNAGLLANKMNNELFNEIFRQYAKPLFYYAAKFVGDEQAKDIVQDLFAKLWSDKSLIIKKSLNSL
jgi:DNA-directed RNA polymerase specialized sigma24 family protein